MKELEELLSSFLENNEDLRDKLIELSADKLKKEMDNAFQEKAELSIKKSKNGRAQIIQQGSAMARLICLAALEKTVLEDTCCPEIVWNVIKDTVDKEKDE